MTQVSKHKLQPEMTTLIYGEFCGFLSKIDSNSGVSQFLDDFLTSTEKIMLSKRFMIMVFLMRGHSVEHIKNTLHVSNSAVMSVNSWFKNASSTTKQSLIRLNQEKNLEKLFDQVESILDKLPPGKYRDWHKVGKEKFARLKTRQLIDRLR
ncbi:MAG: hypothetical protein ABII21_03040 [bacterium]